MLVRGKGVLAVVIERDMDAIRGKGYMVIWWLRGFEVVALGK